MTKVHVQARRYAAEGYTVILIGHAGHEEVVGTMELRIPDSIASSSSRRSTSNQLEFPQGAKLAYVTWVDDALRSMRPAR